MALSTVIGARTGRGGLGGRRRPACSAARAAVRWRRGRSRARCGRRRLRRGLLRLRGDEGVDAEDAEGHDGHREQALDDPARLADLRRRPRARRGRRRPSRCASPPCGGPCRPPAARRAWPRGRRRPGRVAGPRTGAGRGRRRGLREVELVSVVELVVDRVADGRHLLAAAARQPTLGDRGRAGRRGAPQAGARRPLVDGQVDVAGAGGLGPVAVGRGRRRRRDRSGAAPAAGSGEDAEAAGHAGPGGREGRLSVDPACGWAGRSAGAEPAARSTAAAGGRERVVDGEVDARLGDGTAANGAAVVRGPAGGRGAAGREAAGTGGRGSRERGDLAGGAREPGSPATGRRRPASAERSRRRRGRADRSCSAELLATGRQGRPYADDSRRPGGYPGPARHCLIRACLPTVSESNRCNSH